jgi:uncharacterized membrane protein YbhN (UPF0104 family)
VASSAYQQDVRPGAERDAHRLRRGLAWTAALAALLTGIALAIPDLRHVLDHAADAQKGWIVAAVAFELASCLGYVATVRLVLSRGPAREICRLAWAEMAFGAVVPLGGAGSLAVGAWALRAWGVPWTRVANRSAVIFLLTSAVNVAVLGIAGFGVWLGIGAGHAKGLDGLVPAVIAVAVLAAFMALPRWRKAHGGRIGPRRLEPLLQRTASWVSDTEEVAFRPHWRLLGAVSYLVFDIAVLWACLRAVGDHPPVLALVLGYQIGYLSNLVPIPGAIGALDGGLLAALMLYGLPAAPTAAAIVLYHAVALAVPALGGTVAFARLRRTFTDHNRALRPAPEPDAAYSTPASTSAPIAASTPAVNA